ncbi:MAG: Rab family GTPase [Candidatus Thorarchaeota archaeon]
MSLSPTRGRQFKTVLIGDSGVGKTSIRRNYMGKSFSSSHIATLGVDFAQKDVFAEDVPIRLAIWDLAGQHSYESVRKHYYQGCHAIIFVYSVVDSQSFVNASRWFAEVNKYIRPLPPTAFIANKIDLRGEKPTKAVITAKEGESFAERFSNKLGVPVIFKETSAKTGENIQEAFDDLVEMMLIANPAPSPKKKNSYRL